MKIQIISDIHLELYNAYGKTPVENIKVCAPILALAGDIGYPRSSLYSDFLEDMSKKFEHVILITGDHEYYTTHSRQWTVSKINDHIENLVQKWDNVHFLNNKSFYLNGYKFLGTTLWSNIPESEYAIVSGIMNDYSKIIDVTPEITSNWHKENVEWLRKEFEEVIPTIVISHHAPSINETVYPINKSDLSCTCAYQTDLENIMPTHVKLWGYGHTHRLANFISRNGVTQIISNPFGYRSQFKHIPNWFEAAGSLTYDVSLIL